MQTATVRAFPRIACVCLLFCGGTPLSVATAAERHGDASVVRSPDGRVEVELSTRPASAAAGQLQYRVSLSDRPVVVASNLGVRLKDGTELGRDSVIVAARSVSIDASFEQYPGKRRHVIDRANETALTLRERGARPLEWQLIVRAYDDGVAFRYRFPKQPGWSVLELAGELTEFEFPTDTVTTMLPLASFTTSHENRYERRRVAEIPPDQLLGLPLLLQVPRIGWAAVLEANLTNYAGMYLARGTGAGAALVGRLAPRQDEPRIAVRAALPHESPWRLILIADQARRLLESDTVLKLNAPSVIADTSWIKPGKTTFPWWNDFFEVRAPFKMGLNTETARYYIDFCAEYGIPYHTLDGVDDVAWYGGRIAPYEGGDITKGVDGLDLREVIDYARQKGVRIRLWMHWEAARRHMARAFPLYRAWGIEGVMIDFMDRDDQEMVNFQRELLRLAADNRLTVTFHGVAAPTGLERTFPNLLNSEAVRNLEYDKWDEAGVTPEHDVTVPLTRMLAGPLDYHQGTLRGVPLEEFEPRVAAPVVIGTPARMLASYVVLQNHLPMMADYPSAYRSNPLTRLLASVPDTWDDTRALSARVGEEIVVARRSGNDWWIGAMTDRHARDVRVPLSFLQPGLYQAEIHRDDPSVEHGVAREIRKVVPPDELGIRLAAAGGALVKLTLIPAPAPTWRPAWSDDFAVFDRKKWEPGDGERLRVEDGKLAISSGRLVSRVAQRFGRWEVRAKLPGGPQASSTIRLVPDAPFPDGGAIDIMVNRGDRPTITSSAFQWGKSEAPDSFAVEQEMAIGGRVASYADGFHTFACEWVENQLRFYVDDVHHGTFYADEVGYLLPKLSAPMRLVVDVTKRGEQPLLVDWVRIYEFAAEPGSRTFRNGGFDESGGSLAGWHVFGNRIDGEPNVLVQREAVREGAFALKLSGQSTGEANYSGVTQGVSIKAGERVRAKLAASVRSGSGASMKIEFYNHWGDYFGGPALLGVVERAIGGAATPTDAWHDYDLQAVAPAGAVEARLSLVFVQDAREPGAVYIDAVEFSRSE